MDAIYLLVTAIDEVSLLIAIFVGVWVTSFGVTRFGWPSSGLVVAGLAAASFLASPWQLAWIMFASTVTYLLTKALFWSMERCAMAPAFGRDRFLFILLIGLILQGAAQWLSHQPPSWLPAQITSTLEHFPTWTVLLIPLTANQFWKVGVVRGSKVLLFNIAVTVFILLGVLPLISSFNPVEISQLVLERNQSILNQPLFFFVIAIAAAMSSTLNLRYGWDFSGILVPALFVPLVLDPTLLFAMCIEIGVVYLVGKYALQVMNKTELGSIYRLRFFFTVAFVVRFLFTLILTAYFPDHRITDYEGFGFILSALIAANASQRNGLAPVTSPFVVAVPGLALAIYGALFLFVAPGSPFLTSVANIVAPGQADSLQPTKRSTEHFDGGEVPITTYHAIFKRLNAIKDRPRPILDGEDQSAEFFSQVVLPLMQTRSESNWRTALEKLSAINAVAAQFGYRLYTAPPDTDNAAVVLLTAKSSLYGTLAIRFSQEEEHLHAYVAGDSVNRQSIDTLLWLFFSDKVSSLYVDPATSSTAKGIARNHQLQRTRERYRSQVLRSLLTSTPAPQLLALQKIQPAADWPSAAHFMTQALSLTPPQPRVRRALAAIGYTTVEKQHYQIGSHVSWEITQTKNRSKAPVNMAYFTQASLESVTLKPKLLLAYRPLLKKWVLE